MFSKEISCGFLEVDKEEKQAFTCQYLKKKKKKKSNSQWSTKESEGKTNVGDAHSFSTENITEPNLGPVSGTQ